MADGPPLAGKYVLVTAGTGGIGEAPAIGLAAPRLELLVSEAIGF
jgi:NAD(P)-dependent dehydrogenase (short-subunit alcohol dehydrogenase family)